MSFKVKDIVTWESRSTTKTGMVVAVIKPNTPVVRAVGKHFFEMYRVMFDPIGRGTRKEESYLIMVEPEGNRLDRLYWPRTEDLRLVK